MDLIRLPEANRLLARLSLDDSVLLRALAHYQQTTVRTLSPGVRIAIARHVHGLWFDSTPYFMLSQDDDERGRLIAMLAEYVHPRSYTPLEMIVLAGSSATELHFIVKGIAVIMNSTKLLGRGSRIGDAAFTQRAIHNSGVRALTHVQVSHADETCSHSTMRNHASADVVHRSWGSVEGSVVRRLSRAYR